MGPVWARLRQPDVGDASFIAARPAALQDDAGVDAEEKHQAENDQDAENADAAAATGTAAARETHAATTGEREAETAAFVAAILNIFAFSFATPPHLQATSTRFGELAGRNRPFCMARAYAQAQGRRARRTSGRSTTGSEAN